MYCSLLIQIVKHLFRIVVRCGYQALRVDRDDSLERVVHDTFEPVCSLPLFSHEPNGSYRLVYGLQDCFSSRQNHDVVDTESGCHRSTALAGDHCIHSLAEGLVEDRFKAVRVIDTVAYYLAGEDTPDLLYSVDGVERTHHGDLGRMIGGDAGVQGNGDIESGDGDRQDRDIGHLDPVRRVPAGYDDISVFQILLLDLFDCLRKDRLPDHFPLRVFAEYLFDGEFHGFIGNDEGDMYHGISFFNTYCINAIQFAVLQLKLQPQRFSTLSFLRSSLCRVCLFGDSIRL